MRTDNELEYDGQPKAYHVKKEWIVVIPSTQGVPDLSDLDERLKNCPLTGFDVWR